MVTIFVFLTWSIAIGYVLGVIYALIASSPSQDIFQILIVGIAKTGPIGMIWGGIIGILFVALQAIVIPPTKPKPLLVSNGVRRSLFDSMQTLMKKISALAFTILGPAFIGYFLGVISVLIIAHVAQQDSGQIGMAAVFLFGPIGMIIGGTIGILRLFTKHHNK